MDCLLGSDLPVMEGMRGTLGILETRGTLTHTILLPGQGGTKSCFLAPQPPPPDPVPRDLPIRPERFLRGQSCRGSGARGITSTARVAPELLARTWKRRVLAGAVCPPSREVPPL